MSKLASRGAMLFVLATALASIETASAQSAIENSFGEARAVLARAMAAHGGIERIQKLSSAKLDLTGQISTGLQGRSPSAVTRSQPEGDFETHVFIDLAKKAFLITHGGSALLEWLQSGDKLYLV